MCGWDLNDPVRACFVSAQGGVFSNVLPQMGLGRILVVDDDDAFRDAMVRLLTRVGYECVGAAGPGEGMIELRRGGTEAVVVDLNLPGVSGLDFVEGAREVLEGLSAVVLTGAATVETAARSVRLGVVAYLVKPPDLRELEGALRTAVSECRRVRSLREQRRRLRGLDAELGKLIERMDARGGGDADPKLQDQFRASLREMMAGLTEIEGLVEGEHRAIAREGEGNHESLLGAIRRTIEVLSGTKDQFKSKTLGNLRKELESILTLRGQG